MALNISSETRFGDLGPDFDDLVVALAVGDGAFLILALDFDHFLLGVRAPGRPSRSGTTMSSMPMEMPARVAYRKPSVFTSSSMPTVIVQAELQVAILHQLREALLLQQAVDERHVLGQHVVEDHAADRRVHVLLHELDRLGVQDVLVVERLHQVDHAAGVAQLDRRQRFHFAHFERDQHVVGGSERAALALGAGARLGQVVADRAPCPG